jgi:hypothetical protein
LGIVFGIVFQGQRFSIRSGGWLMLVKRLFPLCVFAVCVACLGSRAWADDSTLTEMDPDVAKEYGGKLTEQFNKEFKNLPVKITPDADKAVGLVNADTNEGILLVPLKGFHEENEGPKDAEKDNGIGLCYVFMSPSFKPLVDGKPADAKRLRIMKFKDSEGNEHETLCLECSVKHVEDDWQLMIFSGDKEPLAKSSFEEATDAPKADLALTMKNIKDGKSTLTINLFGKYCVGIPISHKSK